MRTINAVNIEGTLKRSAVVVAIAGLLIAMLGVIAPAASNAASSDAASGSVVCKLKGFRKVVCPTKKLRGPQGPAGAAGPAGPAGPAGSGATSVSPFKFLATGNTPNTTIATLTGAVAEAGCIGNTFTNERIRSTADNGATEVLNLRTGGPPDNNFSFDPDFDTGQSVALQVNSVDDQHGFTYMSAGGSQVATAHYSAYDGAGIVGVFDCAIFGTLQVS